MALVLPLFFEMWQLAEFRVAHNESFDMRMVRIELFRDERFGEEAANIWKAGKAFCTQGQSTAILKLPPTPKMIAAKRTHYKSPNLGEAYEFFTGSKLENAHNAAVDVAACKAVYWGIKKSRLNEVAA